MNNTTDNITNEKLRVKSANAILQCAAIRSVPRFREHWSRDFSIAFKECKDEYHKYLNKDLEKYKDSPTIL